MTLRPLFNLHHLFIFSSIFFCPAKEHCRSYREWELQTRSIALKSGVGGGGWPSPTSRKEEKGVGTLTWLILKIVFLRCLVYLLIQCLIVKWILFFFCSNRSKNNERSTLCPLAFCCQAPELLLAAHILFLYFEYPGTLIPTYYYDYIYIYIKWVQRENWTSEISNEN